MDRSACGSRVRYTNQPTEDVKMSKNKNVLKNFKYFMCEK